MSHRGHGENFYNAHNKTQLIIALSGKFLAGEVVHGRSDNGPKDESIYQASNG